MANVVIQQNVNVDVNEIAGITVNTNPDSGTVGSTFDTTRTALASPGEDLLLQASIENDRAEANAVTVAVTDSHSNNSFLGEVSIDFAEGDDSTVFVEFSNFPLQADQVTPMDKCEYRIHLVGSQVNYEVFSA